MAVKKNFLERFTRKLEDLDANSRQAYILRLIRDRGFFETVFNAIEEGILVIDRRLAIRYFNRAAREMLGLPEDISRIRVSQLLRDVDWRRLMRGDENEWVRVSRQEIELVYPEPRFIQFYLAPHGDGSNLATVILRDVTESRDRAMRELDRERAQAVSMLAAGVAHEIGNPLNSLSLNLQLLERACAPGAAVAETAETAEAAAAETRAMLGECRAEVERLDRLITGFLQALRPGKPQFAPVSIPELIVETLTFMRQEILARGVEVKCDWAAPELPPVRGDAAQLKQCFYNLIRNALQAMGAGGALSIGCRADAEFLYLVFDDTGSGIGPGVLAEMFKPFKTFRPGGNGIGMMIVERVCREHGALLGIDSREGEGTAISIRFPLRDHRLRVLPPSVTPADRTPDPL